MINTNNITTKEAMLNDIEKSKLELEETLTKAKLIVKQHGMDEWQKSIIDAAQIQKDYLRDVYHYLENVAKIKKAIKQGIQVSEDDMGIIDSLDKSAKERIEHMENMKLTDEIKETVNLGIDILHNYVYSNPDIKTYGILPSMENTLIYSVKIISLFNEEAGNFLKSAYSKWVEIN